MANTKMIYLDNAATTPVFSELNEIIVKYNTVDFFNPSTLYFPQKQKSDIRAAKQILADKLGVGHGDMIITSGATEANNLAIIGSLEHKKGILVISASEHSTVYNIAMRVKSFGREVVLLNVDRAGAVIVDEYEELLRTRAQDIAMISIIHVSNETGAINDIAHLVRLARRYNPSIIFHSDGVQAYCKTDTCGLDVDLYSFSGHKFGAPKGVGGLYCRKGIRLQPIVYGGGQEGGLRSGTENVAGLMAMSAAASLSAERYDLERVKRFRHSIIDTIITNIDGATINHIASHSTMPHIVSISLPKINGETLMHVLEAKNIYIGLGSACSSNAKGNRVLDAMGLSKEQIKGIIRISIGYNTTEEDIEIMLEELVKATKELSKYVRR